MIPPETSGQSADQRYLNPAGEAFDSKGDNQHAGNATGERIGGNHRQRRGQCVEGMAGSVATVAPTTITVGGGLLLLRKQFGR